MDDALSKRERDDIELLTGPLASDILSAALAVEGAGLDTWQVRDIHHRPGAGVSVGYTVAVPEGPEQYLVATTAAISASPGPGLVRLESGNKVVHVWRHPADPELPALAPACSPQELQDRLRLTRTPIVELLTYRPTRRAVLRIRDEELPGGMAYTKVVRPDVINQLASRHHMLIDAGVPAPEVLLVEEDGLLVIRAGRGTPLAVLLSDGVDDAHGLLETLVGVLDRLPTAVMDLPRRPAWAERSGHYAHAARAVLPQHSDRINRLANGIAAALAASDAGPLVPTHGDFYEANLLVGDGHVTTLLDVDSVGPGHRVDDLACLLAHVSVLPHLAPDTYPMVPELLATWTRQCTAMVEDPRALNARTAGVVLSLVAGARREGAPDWLRDAEGRLREAESWLSRAVPG